MGIEALLVDPFHAEDPDGADDAEVFLQEAEVDGGFAGGEGGVGPGGLEDGAGNDQAEADQAEQEDHHRRRQQHGGQRHAEGQQGEADPGVEVGDQGVSDVVDFAGEQVQDGADSLVGHGGLAEPVDLSVDLVAEAGGGVGGGVDDAGVPPLSQEDGGEQGDERGGEQGRQGAEVESQGADGPDDSPQGDGQRAMDGGVAASGFLDDDGGQAGVGDPDVVRGGGGGAASNPGGDLR